VLVYVCVMIWQQLVPRTECKGAYFKTGEALHWGKTGGGPSLYGGDDHFWFNDEKRLLIGPAGDDEPAFFDMPRAILRL